MKSVVVALAGFTLAACTTAPLQQAPTLEVASNRLFVAAQVNGVPLSALLDSAAEMSFVDAAWAKQNSLVTSGAETARGSGGTAEVTFAERVTVMAIGKTLDNMTVAVLDLSDISRRLVGRPVPFILGREIFDAARLSIDIEGGAISIADRTATPPGVAFTLTSSRGIESFPARLDGQTVAADLDLGNGSDVMISGALAQRLGLLDDPSALITRKGGGIGGELDRTIVKLPQLEIAGITFANVEAAIDEHDNAGDLNIGVGLLRRFRITTDFEQHTLWLAPR